MIMTFVITEKIIIVIGTAACGDTVRLANNKRLDVYCLILCLNLMHLK